MTALKIALEADDVAATELFCKALGVDELVSVRAATAASNGFRGYSLSLICSQPGNVDALIAAATGAGADVLKPATKSFWGYGGVVQAPDGTIWKVAASAKKDSSAPVAAYDDLVVLLGVDDVKASKRAYVDQGVTAGKSFGGKYAELETAPVKLALYPRKAAAKDAGVAPEGSGARRIVLLGAPFTDPDGYVWEALS